MWLGIESSGRGLINRGSANSSPLEEGNGVQNGASRQRIYQEIRMIRNRVNN